MKSNDNKRAEFDRDTALMVLKAIVGYMYPGNDLFGNKTLIINRDDFESVRKKFLDGHKELRDEPIDED